MTRDEDGTLYIDLGLLLQMLLHHLPVLVISTVACAVLGLLYVTFFTSTTYSASADMLVNNTLESSSTPTISSSDITASSSLVNTYAVILKSHTMLEQVIEDLDLNMTYEQLSNCISVESVNSTLVMRIKVTTDSSAKSLAIVSDIVKKAPDMIIEAAKVGSVETVDAPYASGNPIRKSRIRYMALFALIGLILSAGILILREILNNKFKTEEDLQNILGLQSLGVIPLEESRESTKRDYK